LTILFAYQNDSAWLTFSLIAPALLFQEWISWRSEGKDNCHHKQKYLFL